MAFEVRMRVIFRVEDSETPYKVKRNIHRLYIPLQVVSVHIIRQLNVYDLPLQL